MKKVPAKCVATICSLAMFPLFAQAAFKESDDPGVATTGGAAPRSVSATGSDLIQSGSSTYLSQNVAPGTTEQFGTTVGGFNDGDQGATNSSLSNTTIVAANFTVTFTLNTAVNTNGYDLTSFVSTTSWEPSRVQQHYTIAYSTVQSPASFTPIGTAAAPDPSPANDGSNTIFYDNITTLYDDSGIPLATHVKAIQFTVLSDTVNSHTGADAVYRELYAMGTPTAAPEPGSLSLVLLAGIGVLGRRRSS